MKKCILLFISLLLITLNDSNQAQEYDGPADGSISEGFVMSTEAQPLYPIPSMRGIRIFIHGKPKVEDTIDETIPTGTGIKYELNNTERLKKTDDDGVVLYKSFNGIDMTGFIPPDPHFAVGPNHVMQVVNSSFRISDKRGETITTIDADDWYQTVFATASVFDPKVTYDQFDNRWIMVWLHQDDNASESYYILSVSDDDDPTGTWFTWFLPGNVDGDTPSGNWSDYQGVGYDDKSIYLSSQQWQFGGGFDYVRIRIIDKVNVYVDSNPSTVTWKDLWNIKYPGTETTAFGLRPARMYETADEYYFVVTRWFGSTNSSVGLYKLIDSLGTPVLNSAIVPTDIYEAPPEVEQLGGGDLPIESQGVQLTSEPYYRYGILHLAHEAKYENVAGIRYLAIDVEDNSVFYELTMGTSEHYHIYPAIAVNVNEDVILSYSRSSANEYVGAYYTVIPAATALPTGSFELQSGKDNYVVDYSSGRNRWGDYMGAAVDPADDFSFWVYSEYVESKNRWGAWVGAVRPEPFAEAYINVDKVAFDFGLNEVSDTSDSQILKIANLGGTDLIIDDFVIANSDFKILSDITLPFTIVSLDTLEVELGFSPTEHGVISDTLTIVSNSQLSLDNKVTLTGEGFIITAATQSTMYASTGRGAGSLGRVITIDLLTGLGTELAEDPSGFKPLKSLTMDPTDKMLAIQTTLGDYPTFVRVNALDGRGYEYQKATLDLNVIAFHKDGVIHGITKDNKYYLIDYETLDTTFIADLGLRISAITFNPLTNELYAAVGETTDKDRIYKISSNGDTILVGRTGLSKTLEAISFNNEADLYGVYGRETQFSKLVKIDAQTGVGEEVGPTGFRGVFGLAFAFDPAVSVNDIINLPKEFTLSQNYPNPFNPSTSIEFTLPEHSQVKMVIYNSLGEIVETLVQGDLPAGYHKYNWNKNVNSNRLSSGVYIYSIEAVGKSGKEFVDSKKMVLLK